MRAIKMPAGQPSDEQHLWNREMITEKHKQLNGYNEHLESRRNLAFNQIVSSPCREDQMLACNRMSQLTALRSPAFIAALERLMGLHND